MTPRWKLRYATHLGYLSPDEPLFKESVSSSDPWDHVAFAAENGFAGVLYPWAVSRPQEEVARFRAALDHFGLQAGCTVFAPLEVALSPLWVDRDAQSWETIDAHLNRVIPLAKSLNSRVIVTFIKANPELGVHAQEDAAIERLRRAGDRLARNGLTLGIEHMVLLPGLLHTRTRPAAEFLARLGHPAVQMVFDTGHVYQMGDDPLAAYRLAREQICLIQLADMPGRVQLGAGVIDFAALLSEVMKDNKTGSLIELEHGWTERSRDAEKRGIEALRAIDNGLGQP